MSINKEGTIVFSFDKRDNPLVFNEGINIIWGEFEINGEKLIVITESKTLLVKFNPNTDRELIIFQHEITVSNKDIHKVGVSWSPTNVSLVFDGKVLQKIEPFPF